ncbi:50S ribosomal protein L28 [bacterium]|nr:50S ribosomal protein L28 [bacterium]
MAKQCKLTGKKPLVGNNVSHSNIKTKMRQEPNLRKKRIFDEETGRWVTMKISTSALRSITKLGLKKAIKKYA